MINLIFFIFNNFNDRNIYLEISLKFQPTNREKQSRQIFRLALTWDVSEYRGVIEYVTLSDTR